MSAAPAQDGSSSLFLLVIFMVAVYFLLFRPQAKRAKAHRELVSHLTIGDEIITNAGVYGKIVKLEEEVITVAIAPQVEIKMQKSAVSVSLPKGTLKQLS